MQGTVMCQLQHRSYLVHTTAGVVCHQTWKYLWDRVEAKPDPEPASVTSDVSNKDQTHIHAPQKPYMLHAPAATYPKFVTHQCITPSEQPCTPAKPAVAANRQCNLSAVQSRIEPKIPAPASVPATKVPTRSASHTSMATCQPNHTQCAPECFIEQM